MLSMLSPVAPQFKYDSNGDVDFAGRAVITREVFVHGITKTTLDALPDTTTPATSPASFTGVTLRSETRNRGGVTTSTNVWSLKRGSDNLEVQPHTTNTAGKVKQPT